MEKIILCFGDSNTYGANPETNGRHPYHQRYPGILQGMLGSGYRVLEEGLPGRTTCFEDPVEEGLCGLSYLRPCLHSHAPLDSLVVMLGTNDAKERFSATPRVIAKAMARLLEKALSLPVWQTTPAVLLVAPAPVLPCYVQGRSGPSLGSGCAEKTLVLAAEYRLLAQQLSVDFLDAGLVAKPSETDGLHLPVEAHYRLALALYEYYTAKCPTP